MKIARGRLVEHLRRVYCDGLVPQAAFRGAFATAAVTEINTALVVTEGIEGADALEEPVGVMDLGRLIDVLALGGADPIQVLVTNGRLILELGGTQVALVTCDPRIVTTYVEDDQAGNVIEQAGADGDGFPLSTTTLRTAVAAGRILAGQGKATDAPAVELLCRGDQVGLRYGHSTQDIGLVELPGVVAGYDDVRLLHADTVISVLKTIGEDARIWPGAAESFVAVRSGGVSYYVTPRNPEE